MKSSKAMRDYPTFGIKIDEEYKRKLQQLREAGVDVPELMRPVIYERIDAALVHVAKK